MQDLPRRPTLLLKVLAVTARWSWRVVLGAALILLIAWSALHLFIVPRIGELRGQLESRASSALGMTVRIGAIAARSQGLVPSFELTDVRLSDPQGREALHLPRVLAALSPRSLWNFGFEQIYIDQPQLEIRRTREGKLLVAGLDIAKGDDSDGRASDWLFSQTEVALRGGTLIWIDELRAAPSLVLREVDLVLRNSARRHNLRLDATPPPDWGSRFSAMAKFRQPLLSLHAGRWQNWSGDLYAAFERVEVAQLRRYTDVGVKVAQGAGAVRAWAQVQRGALRSATADIALSQVSVALGADLTPLALASMSGRLSGKEMPGSWELATENLRFNTADGLQWPGGNVRVTHTPGVEPAQAQTEVQADRLDLKALAQIATRLPLDEATRKALAFYAPQGLVERVLASWRGPLSAPTQYSAKARVVQLALAAQPAASLSGTDNATPIQAAVPPMRLGSPGVRGASLDVDLTQAGGRATLSVKDGHIELPGLFDEPVLALAQLSTEVQWQIAGERLSVSLPNLKFSNADAQGEATVKWSSGVGPTATKQTPAQANAPGVLDLQGSLSRADLARLHRYLPSSLDRTLRDYLREALPQARASAVKFRVKGDLRDLPFTDPSKGEFRVSASVRDAILNYVPRSTQPSDSLPWPALTQLNGELLLERASLQLKNTSAKVAGATDLRIIRGEVNVPELRAGAVVNVNLEARGALQELLGTVVNGSPLASITDQMLEQAQVSGATELQLKLSLPLSALEKSTVQGKLTLANNEVQLFPNLPRLEHASGEVHFSEHGFAVSGGQARMLGGEVRAEGGSIAVPGNRAGGPALLRVQGNLTAEGVGQARELGVLADWAKNASGSTSYTAQVDLRQGWPELQIDSNLVGLNLNLPAPLGKVASAAMPLRVETVLVTTAAARREERISLSLGQIASASYVLDWSEQPTKTGKLQPEPRVLRGTVGMGLQSDESVPMPEQGVVANLNLNTFDVDAWSALLSSAMPPQAGKSSPVSTSESGSTLSAYLPTSLALRAKELTATGRKLHQLVVGGSREGNTWRVNADAQELSGYLEYRSPVQGSAGSVYARLARLALAQSSAKEVESLLEEQPISIPALDIVVDDMELRGKRLGRVEVEAVNRGATLAQRDAGVREWRLNKFNVIAPEAVFTATGNWALRNESAPPGSAARATPASAERRRTVMNFKLDVNDAGNLLARLGMKDVIRRGQGKMEGQVAWLGSPLQIDYPSLNGAFNVNVETGQFLKVEPGMAKLLGVLSLQSLPRRLALDFRDVFSEGFSFDFVRGDVRIEQGVAITNNLQMKGVNAAVLMEGRADIAKETQDLKVVVVPEINAGTASLIAGWINPIIGLGSFLAQLILRQPLIDSTTQEFQISGSWTDPKIERLDVPNAAKNNESKGEAQPELAK